MDIVIWQHTGSNEGFVSSLLKPDAAKVKKFLESPKFSVNA